MKKLKKLTIITICLMMVLAAFPSLKADAAITKNGVYSGCFATSGSGWIKVTISGSKLTMKGRPFYAKSEAAMDDDDYIIMKSAKRVFKLNKNTKYYNKNNKRIKLATVKKYVKKNNGKSIRHGLQVTIKKKKVVAVRIW